MLDNYEINLMIKKLYKISHVPITYLNCYHRKSKIYEADIKEETITKKSEFKNIFIDSHGNYIPTMSTLNKALDLTQSHYLFNTITYGDKEGGHWITILIHTFRSKKHCRIYYFDSCYEKSVEMSDIPAINTAIKIIKEIMDKNGYSHEVIYCNKMFSQKYSFHCGVYCIFYSVLSASIRESCSDEFKSVADILEVSDEAMQEFKWLLKVEKISS
jgi:hypothetical protein